MYRFRRDVLYVRQAQYTLFLLQSVAFRGGFVDCPEQFSQTERTA